MNCRDYWWRRDRHRFSKRKHERQYKLRTQYNKQKME
jgi:hypothetical protein